MITASPTNVDHEAFYQDLAGVLRKRGGKLSSLEMLAIAANMVGKIVALQDQRTTSPKQAMEIVAKNIEFGNRTVIEGLAAARGGSA